MTQHENLHLIDTITPHSEREQLENDPNTVYPNDKITAHSIPDPAGPDTHKTAPQTPRPGLRAVQAFPPSVDVDGCNFLVADALTSDG